MAFKRPRESQLEYPPGMTRKDYERYTHKEVRNPTWAALCSGWVPFHLSWFWKHVNCPVCLLKRPAQRCDVIYRMICLSDDSQLLRDAVGKKGCSKIKIHTPNTRMRGAGRTVAQFVYDAIDKEVRREFGWKGLPKEVREQLAAVVFKRRFGAANASGNS